MIASELVVVLHLLEIPCCSNDASDYLYRMSVGNYYVMLMMKFELLKNC